MMFRRWSAIALWLALVSCDFAAAFSPPAFFRSKQPLTLTNHAVVVSNIRRFSSIIIIADDDGEEGKEEEEEEEEENEEEEIDPYAQKAASEFLDPESSGLTGPITGLDWGGALGKLRERVSDIESGVSQSPSNALYRLMTSQTPNQAIGNFVTSANPQVVAAMSGAVNALLGGLSNPAMGVETVVKASGERIGNLCFQLQMTGYMFRNAEYVLALKDLMNIRGSATLQEYKDAFDRLDTDNSGYIESAEIEALLRDVYNDKPPSFEVKAFMQFFDSNKDGKISWKEFEKGLGDMSEQQASKAVAAGALLLTGDDHDDDDEEEDELPSTEPSISGMVEIELRDGKVIEVEANEYIQSLKQEAQALKEALRKEQGRASAGVMTGGASVMPPSSDEIAGGIAGYIASRQGDVKSLTEGISPEVLDTMKRLVAFVLEGGSSKKNKNQADRGKLEMEIPGAALQQLALWQLVLGYRLREAEATGEYRRLLDN